MTTVAYVFDSALSFNHSLMVSSYYMNFFDLLEYRNKHISAFVL